MSVKKQIQKFIDSKKRHVRMSEIYNHFKSIAKETLRARVYESLGKGITRIGRGLYISEEAIVEFGNTMEIINRMVEEGDTFENIFLDIPYKAGGQHGGPNGNRKLFELPTITPEEFGILLNKLKSLLATDTSTIYFMFTSGKSSNSVFKKYFKQFELANLIPAKIVGSYTKLWSNGNRMNMGIHPMPEEYIYVFSKNGKVNIDDWQMHFKQVPNLKEYPTAKPYDMIHTLIEQATRVGDWFCKTCMGEMNQA